MRLYPLFAIICFILLPLFSYSQDVTLEYIFQDTNVINARPSLRLITPNFVYYYADDNFDGSLDLFRFNLLTSETFKYPDSIKVPSEYSLMYDGNLLFITEGDVFISKSFSETGAFTKDTRLTDTPEYETSPLALKDKIIFRRKGDYFFVNSNQNKIKELRLTNDESDSVSYQILAMNENDSNIKILFARYDNSSKDKLNFPNYNNEFVSVERQRRGMSKVKLLQYEIHPVKDSLTYQITTINYSDTIRLSTQYSTYSHNGKELILDTDNPERNLRQIFSYNIESKKIKLIYSEDYIDGWFERHDNATEYIDSNHIIFESEISGYNNLFTINDNGSELNSIEKITRTLTESVLDAKQTKIYFISNEEEPTIYNIYQINFDGTEKKKLTDSKGDRTELRISADGKYLFYKYSYIDKPGELYVLNLETGNENQFTNTISPKFTGINWTIPEIITFNNSEDNQEIHALLYKPKDFKKGTKYPLICFAHGQGYLQNVTTGFSPYQDNFLVDTYFTENGFIILDVDYRGSMGYGAIFRNKTYQNLGYWEVTDYISGIEYLDKAGIIDKNKVGIFGGSYGGFISLMAAFQHSEYFKCAAALRAVSDWKNYYHGNRWFTVARLGDYNEENKKYYELSSPITYAENLNIPLLILHGMLDDNVFFQQPVQLVQKLIDNKKDFEIMYYPKEYHSFHRQSSWLDEYKRIFRFFEKNLK